MQKIPLSLATPGMKLAKPVLKDGGMTIMAEGMELTSSLIARLDSMDVERITVQGTPVEMGGAGAGTRWAERLERLDILFRQYANDTWMTRVKGRMGQYFQLKAAAQEARMRAVESSVDDEHENGENRPSV
ncbi:hypothetical protein GO013_04995 [Pseudodesulfovibrio sp. JC047]|uniref:hypothetical protein n=1 Tax=Pseudodesulfovibrio sp. JC047 TaxID=2683199 RepID=UPI0013D01523|nr:hypothetical protein [Pseudodesulfovibrio sp. JC047]NDV18774.1 hypothetical protein [Pseudodesulfovibrio sp. JC047]